LSLRVEVQGVKCVRTRRGNLKYRWRNSVRIGGGGLPAMDSPADHRRKPYRIESL
jgi:hypothetical protein